MHIDAVYAYVRTPPLLVAPCVPIAAAAIWLASAGLEQLWAAETGRPADAVCALTFAAALHAAWIVSAALRRNACLVVLAWVASTWAASRGLLANAFASPTPCAIVLETIALAVALSISQGDPWAERLARWRRARHDITIQLRMAEGIVPWVTASVDRLLHGQPDRPSASSFDRLAAELEDVEHRVETRVAALALPEEVRQSIITAAQSIVGRAETAAARLAVALERQALEEAAACRDRIARLTDVPAAEREALARQCEALMLQLVDRVGASPCRRDPPGLERSLP